MGGWVGQWVNGWVTKITNNLINLDIIEIVQFCLKRHPHPWVGAYIFLVDWFLAD